MRYTKWLLVILAALLCVPTLQARRMKLMTYNIHHGEGTDRKYAPERIAKMILAEAPEVVALQEVDSATQRIKGHYVAGDIARGCMLPMLEQSPSRAANTALRC